MALSEGSIESLTTCGKKTEFIDSCQKFNLKRSLVFTDEDVNPVAAAAGDDGIENCAEEVIEADAEEAIAVDERGGVDGEEFLAPIDATAVAEG